MGSSNERRRIENNHSEEIERIRMMKDKNDQEAELKKLLYQNNYDLGEKEIRRLIEKDKLEHEAKMEELRIKNEEVNKKHEEKMKELNDINLRETTKENNIHEREKEKIKNS